MTSAGTKGYEHGIRYHAPRRREPGPVVGVAASLLILLVAGQLALAPSARDDGDAAAVAGPVVSPTTSSEPVAADDATDDGSTAAGAAVVELRFDSGADTPSPGAADALDGVADDLLGDPAATVRVIGHAEPSNDRDLEKQLSLERALRVVDLLGRRGVPAERVEVVAAGATQAEEAEADDNRRVTVEVTPG
ncbi:OmpA family protein [Aquipuribacter sp. MA13-6]|uniref:OmpA family protein n=1 Tax=unclassified Aquipuribacter TaxID=2635084 RepID=UPI003EEB9C0E